MLIDFKLFENKIKKAEEFSKKVHKGQYRKGKTEKGEKIEYFTHPKSVAKIVEKIKKSKRIKDIIAAAYLHDVVEDQNITFNEIKKEFGELVTSLVKELTSDEEKIKLLGKEKYLSEKILNMSNWALIIKLADRLHNVQDIPKMYIYGNDKEKKWSKNYAKQTFNILNELKEKRKLSEPQLKLVNEILEKIKIAII
jgi:(p)ppGpp synthase/HD superfamily hydrolase